MDNIGIKIKIRRKMKVSVNVSVAAETNYVDGKTIYCREKDKKITPQNISFGISGYDKVKSLQPLADLINDWFSKQMPVKKPEKRDKEVTTYGGRVFSAS